MRRRSAVLLCFVLLLVAATSAATRWGYHGHEISGRAAATALPAGLPQFFREAGDALEYLNPEPDRWRGDEARELNEAMRYDHYVDLEVIPPNVLESPDRFRYLMALQDSGVAMPARDAGLLPFRMLELYQSLVVEWRLWRREQDPERRALIEQRIINDAGILGHYVADAANPHHTSVHHDRWADGYPNPRGFTTERGFHGRFESAFVGANITLSDVLPHIRSEPRHIREMRPELLAYVQRSHGRLERLYELDQAEPFGAETKSPQHKAFAIERLAAGANMLRDMWWSAYLESANTNTGAGR